MQMKAILSSDDIEQAIAQYLEREVDAEVDTSDVEIDWDDRSATVTYNK